MKGITCKPLSVDCDRITGMQLDSNGKIVMTIFGVYLPYFRANVDQIKLYSETLDILQSAIDGMDPYPIMIVGDMNAPLPRQAELSRYWYRLYPFNRHKAGSNVCGRRLRLELKELKAHIAVPDQPPSPIATEVKQSLSY